jgi:hypothetical protein
MSTSGERRPVLRAVGVAVLLLLQLGGAVLVLGARTPSPNPAWRIPGETADVLGTVEHYGDGVIALTTSQGPATIRVDARTAVTTLTAPATLADVRPGDTIVVWGHDPARVILAGAPAA